MRPDNIFSSVVPDLAIEILSPSDRWAEVERTIAEYLQSGVASVSVLDPSRKEVRTFRRGAPARMLGAGDQLSDPDVLPGLALNVASLFSV